MGNVLAANPADPDFDPEGDPLTVTEVNGAAPQAGGGAASQPWPPPRCWTEEARATFDTAVYGASGGGRGVPRAGGQRRLTAPPAGTHETRTHHHHKNHSLEAARGEGEDSRPARRDHEAPPATTHPAQGRGGGARDHRWAGAVARISRARSATATSSRRPMSTRRSWSSPPGPTVSARPRASPLTPPILWRT